MNSRGENTGSFAWGGGWRHSYDWTIDESATMNLGNTRPGSYTVRYPDGRVVVFNTLQNGTFRGPKGVGDRFNSFDPTTTSRLVYLLLSDGGQVEFQGKKNTYVESGCDTCAPITTYTYSYTATRIIDSHGGVTTFSRDTTDRLQTISEPAGRWLRITYVGATSQRISSVAAGYTINGVETVPQTVSYAYASSLGYNVLTGVNYSDGTGAAYTYQASNTGAGYPLLATCDDVRYPGSMKKIKYQFLATGVYGQLSKEMHPNGTAVATLVINGSSRTETRGDAHSRVFTYGVASQTGFAVPFPYLLSSSTGFAVSGATGDTTYFGYGPTSAPGAGFLTQVKDPKGFTTTFTRTPDTGNLASVSLPAVGGTQAVTQYFYTDPNTGYYLDHVTDPLTHTVQFTRDAKNRRYTATYPDGATEVTTYDDVRGFNQVKTFKNRSGGTETYEYNNRGQLRFYTPAPTTSDPNPGAHRVEYRYDVNDHLNKTLDAFANVTTLYHNERGQLTIVQYPDAANRMVIEGYEYNDDGTLQYKNLPIGTTGASARTDYAYDDYKRLRSITYPAPSTGATRSVVSYAYNRNFATTENYTQAESKPCVITSPTGKITRISYDSDFRPTSRVEAFGLAAEATTSYTYDANGNRETVTSPNGNATGTAGSGLFTKFFYDARNRLTDVDDPMVNASPVALAHKNSSGHSVSWTYDQAGNKKSERRANDQVITFDTYDEMNRLLQQTAKQTPNVYLVIIRPARSKR